MSWVSINAEIVWICYWLIYQTKLKSELNPCWLGRLSCPTFHKYPSSQRSCALHHQSNAFNDHPSGVEHHSDERYWGRNKDHKPTCDLVDKSSILRWDIYVRGAGQPYITNVAHPGVPGGMRLSDVAFFVLTWFEADGGRAIRRLHIFRGSNPYIVGMNTWGIPGQCLLIVCLLDASTRSCSCIGLKQRSELRARHCISDSEGVGMNRVVGCWSGHHSVWLIFEQCSVFIRTYFKFASYTIWRQAT